MAICEHFNVPNEKTCRKSVIKNVIDHLIKKMILVQIRILD